MEENTKTNYDNLLELISGLSEQITNLNTRFDNINTKPKEPVVEKSADELFTDWLNNK